MKKICIGFLFVFLSILTVFSQESFSRFNFSGYRVIIIPSDTFSINIKNGIDAIHDITNDNTFKLIIKDQTGRVPKDTVYIYTKHIDYLQLYNSELVMDIPLYADSLIVELGASYAKLNVSTDYLSVSAGAGSRLSAKGTVFFLNCSVGAGSHVNAKDLIAKLAELNVIGYSSLSVNAEKVIKENVQNTSFFQNVYKKDMSN